MRSKRLHCFLWLAFFLIIGRTKAGAQEVVDGPYVAYSKGQIIISTIQKENETLLASNESFPVNTKGSLRFTVQPEGRPDLAFSLGLKKTIPTQPTTSAAFPKTFFISDIEGEFMALRNLLIAAKVIDTNYNWTFEKGGLVVAGDLFDRGKDVIPVLWLLYKLEDEAKAKGGGVRIILGNHEIMNLSGDHYYASKKYLTSAELLNASPALLLGRDTELGRWLRSKNIMEKIGGALVTHGGVSQMINASGLSINEINEVGREHYASHPDSIPDNVVGLFGDLGPFWYRGYFTAPFASMQQVDSTLRLYGVKNIIVGHSIQPHVNAFYDWKVFGIDVDHHTATPEGLLIEQGKYYRLDSKGNKTDIGN